MKGGGYQVLTEKNGQKRFSNEGMVQVYTMKAEKEMYN